MRISELMRRLRISVLEQESEEKYRKILGVVSPVFEGLGFLDHSNGFSVVRLALFGSLLVALLSPLFNKM